MTGAQRLTLAIIAATMLHGFAHANQFSETAVDLGVGTLGPGLTLTQGIVPGYLNLNVGYSQIGWSGNFTASGARYKSKIKFGGLPITVTLFPFAGDFHLDAGVFFNLNRVSGVGEAINGKYVIGDQSYPTGEVEHFGMSTNFNPVAPYVGLGCGNPLASGSTLAFMTNIGVIYEGHPDADVNVSTAYGYRVSLDDIAQAQGQLNSKLQFLDWWPVLSFSLTYNF